MQSSNHDCFILCHLSWSCLSRGAYWHCRYCHLHGLTRTLDGRETPLFSSRKDSFAAVILSITVLISKSGVAHTVAIYYPFRRKESSPQSSVSLGSVGQVPRHGTDTDSDRHSVPLTNRDSSLFIRYMHTCTHTCMRTCTGVGKLLHTLPSSPALEELQAFAFSWSGERQH